MNLLPDWRAFIELLNSHGVEYAIVGAWARAFHGRRSGSRPAASKPTPDRIIQLGVAPYRIDVITSISGVTFDEAWAERVPGEIEGLPVAFLSLRLYRTNKLASGRPKDLADLDAVLE